MKVYLKIAPNEWNNASRDKRELSVARELGYKIIVMAKGKKGDTFKEDLKDGFFVYRFSTRPFEIPERFANVNRVISLLQWGWYARKIDADIISGHDMYALLIGYISNFLKSSKKKAKLIYDSHEMELYRNKKRNAIQKKFVKLLEGFLIRRADLNMMVNDTIADSVQQIYRLTERPLVIRNIPNYWKIDTKCVELEKEKFRRQLNLTQDGFIIMYHGLIGKGNGVEKLIRALPLTSDVGLVIMGFCYDQNYKYMLEEEIKRLQLGNRVIFKDAVPIEDLYKFVGAADVGMMVFEAVTKSYYYSLPNKLFENIQALTPVICSDFPEMRRIVTTYHIGLTCDPEEVDDIAKCINMLKENQELYAELKKNLEKAKEELCWEKEKILLQREISDLL